MLRKRLSIVFSMKFEGLPENCLAAARSRSRKNNTQLFFYTLAPLRYPFPIR